MFMSIWLLLLLVPGRPHPVSCKAMYAQSSGCCIFAHSHLLTFLSEYDSSLVLLRQCHGTTSFLVFLVVPLFWVFSLCIFLGIYCNHTISLHCISMITNIQHIYTPCLMYIFSLFAFIYLLYNVSRKWM